MNSLRTANRKVFDRHCNGSVRHALQTDDRADERREEEQPPETRRLPKEQNAQHDGSDGADPRPDDIGRADRKGFRRLDQQRHADGQTDEESDRPAGGRSALRLLDLAQAACEG